MNLMIAPKEKLRDDRCYEDASSENHERLYIFSCQSIQQLPRYVSVAQSCGPTIPSIEQAYITFDSNIFFNASLNSTADE